MKKYFLLFFITTLIGTCNGECDIVDTRVCLHDFYNIKVNPQTACAAIENVKQCFTEHGCCNEYKSKHCIKILNKKQLWKNRFAEFHGCPAKVCSCKVENTFRRQHIDPETSSSGFWYFFIWIMFIIFIISLQN